MKTLSNIQNVINKVREKKATILSIKFKKGNRYVNSNSGVEAINGTLFSKTMIERADGEEVIKTADGRETNISRLEKELSYLTGNKIEVLYYGIDGLNWIVEKI